MIYSEYWNPKNETLPREELQALQLLKLRRFCEWTYANSPFHRRRFEAAGFQPEQLKTLNDLRRIPCMTREEWMESLVEKPLFGDLLATDPVNAIRYHLTSGTTGRTPIRVLDSTKDWDWISEMWCYGLWGFGLRPEDIVYFAFGYGSFIGFWGAHYACEKMGLLEELRTMAATTFLDGVSTAQLLKRPEVNWSDLPPHVVSTAPPEVWELLTTELKYEGYVLKQSEQNRLLARRNQQSIPDGFDFGLVAGLRAETRQKLAAVRPTSLGQAARISGITPADISILSIWLSRKGLRSTESVI